MWCKYCSKDSRPQRNGSFICCNDCGRRLEQDDFTDKPTFSKGAGGESRMDGVFVSTVQNDHRESFERTLEKGKELINSLMTKFQTNEGKLHAQASNFYRIALEKGFTRGRKTDQVAGACLYLACRASNKPYLLVNFAIWLGVNVYVLGAVYLQLCKILSLEEHDFVQNLVDPSLFMHRFTNSLMKDNKSGKDQRMVLKTALMIVASMKRDWMQTGRKPSGICGAALYIAALSHGQSYSKTDIIKHVHICEQTLTKRLSEFEDTPSGSLTIEEFTQNAREFEREKPETSDKVEVLCIHSGIEPHFAHGLCKRCYEDFVEISGGLMGGSEPPSFQVCEKMSTKNTKKYGLPPSFQVCEKMSTKNSKKYGSLEADETEDLSDIDDLDVDCYLASEEESRLKKIIWEEMNKEYLEEQAAKNATYVKQNIGDDVVKKREQRKRKRAVDAENAAEVPRTAAEATRQMLMKKGLGSRINFDCLDKLFDEMPLTPTKETRKEEEEKLEDEEVMEDDDNEIGEDQEVYEDTAYDRYQSEYYYEEDNFFDDY